MMRQDITARLLRSAGRGLACAVFLSGCGDGSSEPAAPLAPAALEHESGPLPASIEVPDPSERIANLEILEDLSEEVADELLDLSDEMRRRDFESLFERLTPGFAGHGLDGLVAQESKEVWAAATRTSLDPTSARIVGQRGFIDGLERLLARWTRIDSVLWKTKGAEFQAGEGSPWGKVQIYLEVIGARDDGAVLEVSGWLWARIERAQGRWRLARLQLDSLEEFARPGALFTDVATAAGVGHVEEPFGFGSNRSFAWNGAAVGDVDGDGRFDIFATGTRSNFLYVAHPDGTFAEEAEARGLAEPPRGTGAVFFDFDNDEDQDLLVGHEGWVEDGAPRGERLQLYENRGGKFAERGAELLPELYLPATTLTVLDFNADGFLDVFVCGYGRIESEHNNSWVEATNGAPNALLENQGGKGFRDVAAQAGVRGERWTYASAAADYDRDGDIDLCLANDYGSKELLRNNGDGSFTDVALELGVADRGNGMGVAFGDLDQDGLLDLYLANMSSTAGNRILKRLKDEIDPEMYAALVKLAAGNTIQVQTPEGRFRALPAAAGGINASWAWSPVLADFDLDGALDIFCANGFVTGASAHDT
jgi:hypothetical protein